MIRYTLKCDKDHSFESWFQSSDAFETLNASGNVACPQCGSATIEKSLMTPRVPAKLRTSPEDAPAKDTPEAALAKMRKDVEDNSDYVGMQFAAEARKIHDGDAPERNIYGEAKIDEAKALIEDGIPVAPLPFIPKAKTN